MSLSLSLLSFIPTLSLGLDHLQGKRSYRRSDDILPAPITTHVAFAALTIRSRLWIWIWIW
jgi:hypothetical protein